MVCVSERDQLDTENVFITQLKILVKTYGYNNMSEMMRDKIMCSVKSTIIRKKLLVEGNGLTET